jgi:hypothetical protein
VSSEYFLQLQCVHFRWIFEKQLGNYGFPIRLKNYKQKGKIKTTLLQAAPEMLCTIARGATHHEGFWGERRYSSYSLSASALDGGEW